MTTVYQNQIPVLLPQNPKQKKSAAKFWLLGMLFFGGLLIGRVLMWKLGVSVPQRILSAVLSIISMTCLYLGYRRLKKDFRIRPNSLLKSKILIFNIAIAAAFGIGIFRQNSISDIFKELVFFSFLSLNIMVWRYDIAWTWVRKPVIVMFYLSVVLVALTQNIPGIVTTAAGSVENAGVGTRSINTVAFSLRPISIMGLFLCAHGLASNSKSDPWNLLELGGIIGYLVVNLYIFSFRSSIFSAALLILPFLVFTKKVSLKFLVGIFSLALMIGVGWWLIDDTDLYNRFLKRFQDNDMFGGRITEASGLFDQLKYEILIGRGLGGYYISPWTGDGQWRAVHLGVLGFVLRGGLGMATVFLTFFISFNFLKTRAWFQNPQNFAAFLMVPWILASISVNPIGFSPDGVFATMTYGFCIARLNVFEPSNSSYSS